MISGKIKLPGDKSISHRAALFSALRAGSSEFTNFNSNDDCTATLSCLSEMGIDHDISNGKLKVYGRDFWDWKPANKSLFAGNSGTTARLISGLLAAQKFATSLTGDESLTLRPMKRVIDPLTKMGALINSSNGYLPLHFTPVKKLNGISYNLPMASAQVKSAILLAGLFSDGTTEIFESAQTRDHTERMLNLEITEDKGLRKIKSSGDHFIPDISMHIPGDFSSAAFFIAAALLIKGSSLLISDVSLNPTRTGLLTILEEMGADIQAELKHEIPEPIGDLEIKFNTLQNIKINDEIVPNIIDEIPILAIIASQSEGKFEIRNAKELRFKESDRIKTIVNNLENIGVNATEFDDGFSLNGPQKIKGGLVTTHGDHRIAMAFSIAGLFSEKEVHVDKPECASVSFPGFYKTLKSIII
ncbi:MAG: 3-phosphoshikimate 1-carboxyvinyltransferase [Calditrichae bacterium]|nr:3-phosphoshikimate 1-carboxyvinyltransferase [Calditrichota bacterium]MCB9057244.1 3-phosphoshikimate 1-carboxyvinyltransferase [Calditrichia bacterium]